MAVLVLGSGAVRFQNGFVYDDVPVILEGTLIHEPSRLVEAWTGHTMVASASDPGAVQSVDTYRPMPITSFAIDAAISGRDPWAYHLTSLLLHLVCSLLVFTLAVTWLGTERRAEALYGAAVFAVHPWSVEAHGWINGRSDPLALAFGLLALLALLRAETTRRRGWRIVAGATFLLGLLSKETLITLLPAMLLLPSAHSQKHESPWTARVRSRLPALATAAVVYLGARAAVLGGAQTHRDGAMLHDAAMHLPWLLVDGLRQLLAPSMPYLRSLHDEYASVPAWQSALSVSLLLALGFVAWRFRRRAPLSAASLAWMVLPLVPIAILCTVLWPGFGRYLYLPSAGLAWGLAELASHLRDRIRPGLRVAFAVLHVSLFATLTVGFLRDFSCDDTLYRASIDARPDVAMGWGWLGMSRAEARPEAAVAPLERAVALDPDTARYRLHLTRSQLASGDRAGAFETASEGIAQHSGTPEAAGFHIAALNAMPSRDAERAVHHVLACLEVWPGRADCEAFLTELLEGRPEGEHCQHALARTPSELRQRVERGCGAPTTAPGPRPAPRRAP